MKKWEYRTIYFEWTHNLITSGDVPVINASSKIIDTHSEKSAQFEGAVLPIHETINALGADGWELVSVVGGNNSRDPAAQVKTLRHRREDDIMAFFKRPV